MWEMWLEVSGDAPLEIAAYGHYVGAGGGEALDALYQRLPATARAGLWHFFVSLLSRRTVVLSGHAA